MTPEFAVQIIKQALVTAVWVAAPLLLIGFVIGIVMNVIQIATSMQDSAFSTAPRLAAFFVGFVLLLPWMLNRLMTYTTTLFGDLSRYAK
ncbi:MAG TPA: flagellar biosynthetic protein FliQ [Bryobacteraceae bacterium]|nr:flagellar biosynthetic protein FliQ [Bryobacteraceae bacterium]